jgi:hypothetical protein
LVELEKENLVHSMKAGLSQFFVAVKQEKKHHQKSEENPINAPLKGL